MRWDYIIVGQGLAGSVLSFLLCSNNKKVLVIDDESKPKASTVAAGIYNPFTGRKMAKTWMLEHLFPFLEEFYKQVTLETQTGLLHPLPMYRPFLSLKEQNEWGSKTHDPSYSHYIDHIVNEGQSPAPVRSPWGGLFLKNCGFINLPDLIVTIKNYLKTRNGFIEGSFNYDDLIIKQDAVEYQGKVASKIIFCEGPNLSKNPYFNWLPLRPVKGETLLVELSEPLPYIVNRGIFILPLDQKVCKVGATFEHNHVDWEPSTLGKTTLETKLQRLINLPYKIIDQKAGIRPATEDRRPFIGLHPEHEPLGVFNGLGTKGVSLAPYFAQKFFEFLEQGRPLLNDVSINRYF